MRKRNWEQALIAAVNLEQSKPFDWQSNNCGHLIALAITACIGEHPVLQYLNLITDKHSALKVLAENGGLDGILGKYFWPVGPLSAMDGDVGYLANEESMAGCIVVDNTLVFKPEGKGLFRAPITKATKLFMVR